MKQYIKLNEDLTIEQINERKRTIISVINGKEKILLSDLKTDYHFWSKFVFNDTYIVAYSRGCMINHIPFNMSKRI